MRAILKTLLVTLLVAGCGGAASTTRSTDDAPRVVVTTGILGDIASRLGAGQIEVEVVMPAGADPHDFAVSARQAEAMAEADLLVVNGAGFEQGLRAVLAKLDGLRFTAADHVRLRTLDGGPDPHIWTDPRQMVPVVRALGEQLQRLDGVDREAISEATDRYAALVTRTDRRIATRLADIPAARRVLVTNHEVLGYFAARYDLRVVGAVVPSLSTQAAASTKALDALAAVVRREQVPAIFAETSSSTRLAEALAEAAGERVVVVELYSESLGEPGSGADSYLGMLRVNADRVAEALVP